MKYDHKNIEKKWQEAWKKTKIYTTPDEVPGKDNFYLLVEFPYPSGNLHVGHWYAFAVPDILARFMRMQGKNVLYPIGFDAFGLPAENAAIKNKLNPRTWTYGNIDYMKKQIASMGASFDLSREVITCDPEYYKWTQWLFLQLFKKGLVYQKETAVNWCPKDLTVLANEQVIDGKCDRCGSEVQQRQMLQWNIKITDYADRLIDDLKPLDWPEQIKESQKNWIGRSEGAEILFPLADKPNELPYKFVLLHGFRGSPATYNWLSGELRKLGHEVVVPSLPTPEEPTEDAWVDAALNATTYDERTILFGYSLGAAAALKVLEKLPKKIAGVVLAGGFIDPKFADKQRNFEDKFVWNFDSGKIRSKVGYMRFLHDTTDVAVSEGQAKRLSEHFDVPLTYVRAEKPHFEGEKEFVILNNLVPSVTVFTTRPDTLFGATYLVLAPEHTMVGQLQPQIENWDEVDAYVKKTQKMSDMDRQTTKEKTGALLKGVEAINPANGEKIPVYIADYVLPQYGTGSIMAVPAHDERDFEFAQKFDLPIREVVEPLVVRKGGPDAFRSEDPAEERTAAMALVQHWSEDKFLCLRWDVSDVHGFVTGGIEEGESPTETAIREVEEETGYSTAEFVRALGGSVHTKFFAAIKNVNRFAHFTPLLLKLRDGSRSPVDEREIQLHEPVWMDAEKVSDYLNRDDFQLIWQRAQRGSVYTGDGLLANSSGFDGLETEEAKEVMTEKYGRKKTTYKLRDWIVSRQRYWGVPIPMIHCDACGHQPVPDNELPVLLPEVEDYLPEGSGKSPLAKVDSFVNVKCPKCGAPARRETDTLDTFVDSSWYFLRYTDPKNASEFAAREMQDHWMPVDLYSGGAEHTTMHLLYSRFWHKALFDIGLVKDAEPYQRRMNRSLILGPDGQKMSKSRGNVIDPDEIVEMLGADTVRMYLAFVGPYNEVASYPWNPDGVVGVRRFLERFARVEEYVQDADVDALNVPLHKAIKKVGEDIAALKFNTAISQLMILLNAIEKDKKIGKAQWVLLVRMLAPFAPHLAEELWSDMGNTVSIHLESWPAYDEKFLQDDVITIAIQINGKMRGEIRVPHDIDKVAVEAAAKEEVAQRLEGQEIIRTVVVPGRLVNFVVKL